MFLAKITLVGLCRPPLAPLSGSRRDTRPTPESSRQFRLALRNARTPKIEAAQIMGQIYLSLTGGAPRVVDVQRRAGPVGDLLLPAVQRRPVVPEGEDALAAVLGQAGPVLADGLRGAVAVAVVLRAQDAVDGHLHAAPARWTEQKKINKCGICATTLAIPAPGVIGPGNVLRLEDFLEGLLPVGVCQGEGPGGEDERVRVHGEEAVVQLGQVAVHVEVGSHPTEGGSAKRIELLSFYCCICCCV